MSWLKSRTNEVCSGDLWTSVALLEGCLLYTSPSPRDSCKVLVMGMESDLSGEVLVELAEVEDERGLLW